VCVCVCVCLCLSVRDHIFRITRPMFTKFIVHVTYGLGSVLRWRNNDALCTSGLWLVGVEFNAPLDTV